eukprot:13614977-Alexandrium_andersonii.AAC.1
MKAVDTYWAKPRLGDRVKGDSDTPDAMPAVADDGGQQQPAPPCLFGGGVPSTAEALDLSLIHI